MQRWPARLLLSAVCLVLGVLLVSQFRSQRIDTRIVAQNSTDQASYISQLYSSNIALRASLTQLQAEITRYEQSRNGGSSNLVNLLHDLQQLRMANGEVDVTGPGVQVQVTSAQDITQVLQDLVNELRSSGAEAIALNRVRLITRSVIEEDAGQHVLVDKQPVSSPYLLEAIGDPATLQAALERKGGVIALLQEQQADKMTIKVARRGDKGDAIRLPKTALESKWLYAHPTGPTGN